MPIDTPQDLKSAFDRRSMELEEHRSDVTWLLRCYRDIVSNQMTAALRDYVLGCQGGPLLVDLGPGYRAEDVAPNPGIIEGQARLFRSIAQAIDYHHRRPEEQAPDEVPRGWPERVHFAKPRKYENRGVSDHLEVINDVASMYEEDLRDDFLGVVLYMFKKSLDGGSRGTRNKTAHADSHVRDEAVYNAVRAVLPWVYVSIAWRPWPPDSVYKLFEKNAKNYRPSPIHPGSAVDVLGWYGFLLWIPAADTISLGLLGELPVSMWKRVLPLFPMVVTPEMLEYPDAQLNALSDSQRQALGTVVRITKNNDRAQLHVVFPELEDDLDVGERPPNFKQAIQIVDEAERTFLQICTDANASAGIRAIKDIRGATIALIDEDDYCGNPTGRFLYLLVKRGPTYRRIGIEADPDVRVLFNDTVRIIYTTADTEEKHGPCAAPILPGFPVTFTKRLSSHLITGGNGKPDPDLHVTKAAGLSGMLYLVDTAEARLEAVHQVTALLTPAARGVPWLPDLYGRGIWKLRPLGDTSVTDIGALIHVPMRYRLGHTSSLASLLKQCLAPSNGAGHFFSNDVLRLTWSLWVATCATRALKSISDSKVAHRHVCPEHVQYLDRVAELFLADFRYSSEEGCHVGTKRMGRYVLEPGMGSTCDRKSLGVLVHDLLYVGLFRSLPMLPGGNAHLDERIEQFFREPTEPSFALEGVALRHDGRLTPRWLGDESRVPPVGPRAIALRAARHDRRERLRTTITNLISMLQSKQGAIRSIGKRDVKHVEAAFDASLALLEVEYVASVMATLHIEGVSEHHDPDAAPLCESLVYFPGWRPVSATPGISDSQAAPPDEQHALAQALMRLKRDWNATEPGGQTELRESLLSVLDAFLASSYTQDSRRCGWAKNRGIGCTFSLGMRCPCTTDLHDAVEAVRTNLVGLPAKPVATEVDDVRVSAERALLVLADIARAALDAA